MKSIKLQGKRFRKKAAFKEKEKCSEKLQICYLCWIEYIKNKYESVITDNNCHHYLYGNNKRFAEKIFALLSTGVLQIKQKYYFDFHTKVYTRN